MREGPKEGGPLVERVLKISYDPCRSARIALVASGDRLRFITATTSMKEGDLISTLGEIPRIPSKQEALMLIAILLVKVKMIVIVVVLVVVVLVVVVLVVVVLVVVLVVLVIAIVIVIVTVTVTVTVTVIVIVLYNVEEFSS